MHPIDDIHSIIRIDGFLTLVSQDTDWKECAKKLLGSHSTQGDALKNMFFKPNLSLEEFVLSEELSTQIAILQSDTREPLLISYYSLVNHIKSTF
jgi:hypothetical protein